METQPIDFALHYFLTNQLHEIDAITVHKAEGEAIALIEQIISNLNLNVSLDFVARTEGGIRNILRLNPRTKVDKIILEVLKDSVSGAIGGLIVYALTNSPSDFSKQTEQVNLMIKNQQTQIELQKENNELNKQILEKLQEISERTDSLKKADFQENIRKKQNNLYSSLYINPKVTAFSVESIIYQGDKIQSYKELSRVKRDSFDKFLTEKTSLPVIEDKDATVIIVSPVLNKSKYKWKGIYKDEQIDFSMLDKDFKEAILAKQITFGNGDILSGLMEIHRKSDNSGKIISETYVLREVYATEHSQGFYETKKGALKRDMKNQMCLFDEEKADAE